MKPDEIEVGAELVIGPDPKDRDGNEHPVYSGGEVVKVVRGPDSDGEVYVNGEAVSDGAAVGGYVLPEYLLTHDQAEAILAAMMEDDDEWQTVTELPAYEDLPLGYAIGLVAWLSGTMQAIPPLGNKPLDPPGFPIHFIPPRNR